MTLPLIRSGNDKVLEGVPSALYAQTEAGLWVPVLADDEGGIGGGASVGAIAEVSGEKTDPKQIDADDIAGGSLAALTKGLLHFLAAIDARDAAAYASTSPVGVSTRAIAIAASNAVTAGTRQANATPYSINDAVSNHATPGSVVAFVFTAAEANDLPISLEGLLLRTDDTGPGSASAIFRCWFYQTDPAASTGIVGGDNLGFSTKRGTFLGVMEGTFRAFSDGSCARLIPVAIQSVATIPGPTRIITKPGSGAATVYMLMQTLTAFTPSANSTVFTPTLEGFQFRA